MSTFYSNCSPLVEGCILYNDSSFTNILPIGYYSNGVEIYQVDGLGRIIAITTCTPACDITIVNITSTDPTTIGGSDGTITIDFTTSNGPSTYKLNNVPMGAAVSPLVITGLSSSVEYIVELTDSNSCVATTAPITLGISATVFDADWIMATYEFVDGSDLDTRTRIALPNSVGQDIQQEYLGWGVLAGFDPINGSIIVGGGGTDPLQFLILFGNDNTGNGFESILFNIKRFKTLFPGETQFTIDLRAFWYGSVGTLPVNTAITLWKDADPVVGVPIHNGCQNLFSTPFCWTYPGAALTKNIDSVPFPMNNPAYATTNPLTGGIRVATLTYDLNTFIATLNNADTTTPAVTGIPF